MEPMNHFSSPDPGTAEAINNLNGTAPGNDPNAAPKIWYCTGRTGSLQEGYLYAFELNSEVYDNDDALEFNGELFPAIEPTLHAMYWLASEEQLAEIGADVDLKTLVRDDLQTALLVVLHRLGYSQDSKAIYFPDIHMLSQRWELLRKELPQLPPFDFIDASNVVSHMDFIAAQVEHDGLISHGREFLHDHFFHFVPKLMDMLKQPNLAANKDLRAKTAKALAPLYQRLKTAERLPADHLARKHIVQLQASLSAFVDSELSTQVGKYTDQASIEKDVRIIWTRPGWSDYAHEQFGADTQLLPGLWDELLAAPIQEPSKASIMWNRVKTASKSKWEQVKERIQPVPVAAERRQSGYF